MRSFEYILLTCSLIIVFGFACTTKDVSGTIAEIPPSLIYSDDDSTILGQYSNVGKKGPDLAPYFRVSLKKDLEDLLSQKDKTGEYVYRKKNGDRYDIYSDELKIYTTINPALQKYAEAAVGKHLSEDLQPAFTENNSKTKRFPFSDTYNGRKVTDETIQNILKHAIESTKRYKKMSTAGVSASEIIENFEEPVKMKVFSWKGEIDTVLSPLDSIRYYKNIIRSGLLSIEPSTGYVKAWVGGIDYEHFAFDHVKQGKRQIGSAIKPFTYAAAFSMGVAEPCTVLDRDEGYCVDPCDPSGKRLCPTGAPSHNVKANFTFWSSGTTVPIMSLMGSCSGPQTMAKHFEGMNIEIPKNQITPSISLGTPDVSLYDFTAAYTTFVNNGLYIQPRTIRRIEDKQGNVIYSSQPKSKEVYNSMITFDVLQMMEDVVSAGASTSLRWHKKWGGITQPTAGKAGTTQGNADMWFFGITPDLVTGVWTGGEDRQVRFRSFTWGQGARGSLPIYGYYMQQVYADSTLNISTEGFEAPASYPPGRFDCDEQKNGEPFR